MTGSAGRRPMTSTLPTRLTRTWTTEGEDTNRRAAQWQGGHWSAETESSSRATRRLQTRQSYSTPHSPLQPERIGQLPQHHPVSPLPHHLGSQTSPSTHFWAELELAQSAVVPPIQEVTESPLQLTTLSTSMRTALSQLGQRWTDTYCP